MAIDTENKRYSFLSSRFNRMLPYADGSIDNDDRAMHILQYAYSDWPLPELYWFPQGSAAGDWNSQGGASSDWFRQVEK